MFQKIIGLKKVTARMEQVIRRDSITGAYLFIGKKGRGKSFLVLEFVKLLFCKQQNACENCPSCRLFEKSSHPDFLVIKKRKNFIEIAQIQELVQEIMFAPAMGKYRIVFLKEVENMNNESANAFLKILEEPPTSCRFILSTTNEQMLPETIVSRCQRVFFPEPTLPEIERIILQDTNLTKDEVAWSFPFQKSGIQKEWFSDIQKFFEVRQTIWQLLSDASSEGFTKLLNFGEQQEKEPSFASCFFFFCAFFYDLWLLVDEKEQQEFFYSPDLKHLTQLAVIKYEKEQIYNLFQKALTIENSIQKFANKSLGWCSLVIGAKNSRMISGDSY